MKKKKKVKPVLAQGEEVKVKSYLDMIAPSVVKFFPDHFICGNTYRCVWALREYPTSTEEQAILKHLGEKNGVTLRIYTRQVSPTEEKKIIPCHIGNGASVAAVKYGKVIDTSMGLTPLDGFVMGTRCGGIDPSVVTYVMDKEGLILS